MAEQEVTTEQLARLLPDVHVDRVIVYLLDHHTWRPTVHDYHQVGGAATVRGVTRYHVQVRGWSDNGYHIMIGPDGRIWLCRPMRRSGAHCVGRNHDSIGVSLIGNYDRGHDQFWGSQGAETLFRVLALLCRRFDLPVSRVRPHSAYAAKTCPGTSATDRWGEFLQEVQAAMTLIKPNAEVFLVEEQTTEEESRQKIDCRAVVRDGVTRVDLRPVAEALGAGLAWDPEAKAILLKRNPP